MLWHDANVDTGKYSASAETSCRLRTATDPRDAEDQKALELREETPEWWGKGLMQEVEALYRQEVRTYNILR